MSTHDPFAPPRADPFVAPSAPADVADAERLRRAHLNHEASIQAVGALYYLTAISFVVTGVAGAAAGISEGMAGVEVAILGMFAALGVGFLILGRLLRKLDPRARVPVIVLTIPGLLGVPFGTLISAYILWLVGSARGRYVLSPEYHAVVHATPHIVYRSPIAMVVAVLLIVLILAIAVIGALK